MKWFFSLALLFSLSVAQAQVSQDQVGEMLDQMVQQNMISAEEAFKAKLRMKNMNNQEWTKMNTQAAALAASRGPASVRPIEEASGSDLDGQQFQQIKEDIRKIMPSYGR